MARAGGVANGALRGQWAPLVANPRRIHSVAEGPRRVLNHVRGRSPAKLIQVHIVDAPQVGRQGLGIGERGLGTRANGGGAHCGVAEHMCPTLPLGAHGLPVARGSSALPFFVTSPPGVPFG